MFNRIYSFLGKKVFYTVDRLKISDFLVLDEFQINGLFLVSLTEPNLFNEIITCQILLMLDLWAGKGPYLDIFCLLST